MDDSLLTVKRRRLNVLQLQAARYGIDTPPHVTIEIEDLTREIAMLEKGNLPSSSNTTSSNINQTTIGGSVTGTVLSGTFNAPVNVGTGSNPPPSSTSTTAHQAETILAVFAQPQGLPATRWEYELRELRNLLTSANQQYRLQELSNCTPKELFRALIHFRPSKFHFQGHGTKDGIILTDTTGDRHQVSWQALIRTLDACETIGCVVLNACDSQVHAQVGRQRFHLITSRDGVNPEATRVFSQGFYDALIAGQTVPQAFRSGRNLLDLEGIAENEWPVLSEARA